MRVSEHMPHVRIGRYGLTKPRWQRECSRQRDGYMHRRECRKAWACQPSAEKRYFVFDSLGQQLATDEDGLELPFRSLHGCAATPAPDTLLPPVCPLTQCKPPQRLGADEPRHEADEAFPCLRMEQGPQQFSPALPLWRSA